MTRTEKAIYYFKNGYNCAQSVLISFNDDFKLNETDLLKISCGLGAGMGRLQKTCGAVSGAYLILGLYFGKYLKEDDQSREKTYKLIREFDEKFNNKYKTTDCKTLLNCDLSTEEGKQYFFKNELVDMVCAKCIEDSVKILESIIKENGL